MADEITLDDLGDRIADWIRQSDLPAPIKQYLAMKGFQGSLLGGMITGLPETARSTTEEARQLQYGGDFSAGPSTLATLGTVGAPMVGPAVTASTLGAGALRRTAVPPGALTKAERAATLPNAPYPQFAEQYPAVGPPVATLKEQPSFPGETYPKKTLTPDAEAFANAREKIMADMKKKGYTPYFDPAERFSVDPTKYPPRDVDTAAIAPVSLDKIAEYLKVIDAPETRAKFQAALARGEELGGADRWYFMGQLEREYTKELGAKQGRAAFLDEFARPMAGTTSGNRPTPNFLFAHYLEFLRKRGEPIPEGHQLPYPVGGRRPEPNIASYEGMRARQAAGESPLTAEQPKMYDFSRSYIGDLSRPVIDEQMAKMAGDVEFQIRARKGAYGLMQRPVMAEAAARGVEPGAIQDIAWAGFQNEPGKPMIAHINDAIERTHRLTGMPRDEIVRRGLVRKEIPIYGLTAPLPTIEPQ